MARKTLAEMFAPHVAGRYAGQPATAWQLLETYWRGSFLTDAEVDILLFDTAREVIVEGKGHDVERPCLMYDLTAAIDGRDFGAMLVLTDAAEDVGINPELCDLTRRTCRVHLEMVR